jgi:hypothetical protein
VIAIAIEWPLSAVDGLGSNSVTFVQDRGSAVDPPLIAIDGR